ncbi:MFS transporter [Kitasatospora sp. NPDC007106]|uniref:MFS transporter n=1 Tax=Kitasatospora sp. NPDC007106 TaxID=3156914 RepID=UPI0033CD0A13
MTTTSTGAPAASRASSRLLHPDPTVRRLAAITLVNTLGNGLFMTLGALYFTRMLGLPAAQVGIGLTAAGLCGVLIGVPAGRAADRWGTKPVLLALVGAEAVGTACYPLVSGFTAFVLLACAVTATDRGTATVRNALYAEVLPPDRRVAGRAYLRVVTNVGIGVGTGIAALVLVADTRGAYTAAILADVATFVAVFAMYALLPTPQAGPRGTADESAPRTGSALRNLPYLVVAGLAGVLGLQFAMIEVGVPLWIVDHTEAPRVLVACTLVVNTILVVALQVRATRGTEEPTAAARIFRRGGVLVALSCAAFALAGGLPAWAAVLVLLAGASLQALGEVLGQAAGWALGYDLAEEGAHGEYQGVFNTGFSAAMMLGPVLITTAVIGHGTLGWAALAGLFAAASAAMVPAVGWALRRKAAAAAA